MLYWFCDMLMCLKEYLISKKEEKVEMKIDYVLHSVLHNIKKALNLLR